MYWLSFWVAFIVRNHRPSHCWFWFLSISYKLIWTNPYMNTKRLKLCPYFLARKNPFLFCCSVFIITHFTRNCNNLQGPSFFWAVNYYVQMDICKHQLHVWWTQLATEQVCHQLNLECPTDNLLQMILSILPVLSRTTRIVSHGDSVFILTVTLLNFTILHFSV